MSNKYCEQKSLDRKRSERFKPTSSKNVRVLSPLNRKHSQRNSTQAAQFISARLNNKKGAGMK